MVASINLYFVSIVRISYRKEFFSLAKPQSSQSFSKEYPGNSACAREFLEILCGFARDFLFPIKPNHQSSKDFHVRLDFPV
jgi:hypothetical protein